MVRTHALICFGGVKNAEKALKGTNFSFGPTEGGAGAEILGKNVTIDPNGTFMSTSGSDGTDIPINSKRFDRCSSQRKHFVYHISLSETVSGIEVKVEGT